MRPPFLLLLAFPLSCAGGDGRDTDGQTGGPTSTPQTTTVPATTGVDDLTTSSGGVAGTTTTTGVDDSTTSTTTLTTTGGELTTTSGTTGPVCEPLVAANELIKTPLDLVFYLDTSSSMGNFINALEAEINGGLAQTLDDAGVDFRLILIATYPQVCIAAPLSGGTCDPAPPEPAVVDGRYYFYQYGGGSAGVPNTIFTNTYAKADVNGDAPMGWSAWIRDESFKVLVAMTDGQNSPNAEAGAAAVDQAILALAPDRFGAVDDRRYVFHAVAGFKEHDPPQDPYPPADALVAATCPTEDPGPAITAQALSVLTGGLRISVCSYPYLADLFKDIADAAVETSFVCTYEVDTGGEPFDPKELQVVYIPGAGQPITDLDRVPGPDACTDNGFWTEVTPDDKALVHLCPDACAKIQADPGAELELRYGCPVDPG